MRRRLNLYASMDCVCGPVVVLIALLISAMTAGIVVPPRLVVPHWSSVYQQSEDEDSEPSESPEDDGTTLCQVPQNRIRRQEAAGWLAVQPPVRHGHRLHRHHLSPADLSRQNGIGGPLRC